MASPSADQPLFPAPPPPGESARQRALRIRLDYVHRPDRLTRVKLRLALLAAVITLAYAGWVLWGGLGGREQLSPGDVASVHQAWKHECQACHADFVPLADGTSLSIARWLSPHGANADAVRAATAERCQTCHPVADHHRLQRSADIAACSACHQDHRGSTADLRRVANAQCTRCHAQLDSHRSGSSSVGPPLADVGSFAATTGAPHVGHPEFRSLREDPGKIKFNHRLHMTPGLPAADAAGRPGRPLMTLADLPADQVERYRGSDQAGGQSSDHERLVQLDCAACHHLAPDPSHTTTATRSAEGAYYLPVVFERDCQACHPLRFDPQWPTEQLPHRLSIAGLRQFLERRYSLPGTPPDDTKPPQAVNPFQPNRVVPGRSNDADEQAVVQRTASARTRLAFDYLQRQAVCTKCHFERPASAPGTDATSASLEVAGQFRDLMAAGLPSVWFRHAHFDHRPHRQVQCRECHAAAYGQTTVHSVVMIAGRDSCLPCHQATGSTSRTSAARSDCVLCHRYHASDVSTGGAANPPRSISDWLRPNIKSP